MLHVVDLRSRNSLRLYPAADFRHTVRCSCDCTSADVVDADLPNYYHYCFDGDIPVDSFVVDNFVADNSVVDNSAAGCFDSSLPVDTHSLDAAADHRPLSTRQRDLSIHDWI